MMPHGLLRFAAAALLHPKTTPAAYTDAQHTWLVRRLRDYGPFSEKEAAALSGVVVAWYDLHMPTAAAVLHLAGTVDPPWTRQATLEGYYKVMEIGEKVRAKQKP